MVVPCNSKRRLSDTMLLKKVCSRKHLFVYTSRNVKRIDYLHEIRIPFQKEGFKNIRCICILYGYFVNTPIPVVEGLKARVLQPGLRVRVPPGSWMSVSRGCCVLSGRGLCDGPVLLPEGVLPTVVCHRVKYRNLTIKAALTRVGLLLQIIMYILLNGMLAGFWWKKFRGIDRLEKLGVSG